MRFSPDVCRAIAAQSFKSRMRVCVCVCVLITVARIVFKVAKLTFRALHGTAQPLLDVSVYLCCWHAYITGEGCDLHRLISSTFRPSVCQLSVVARFRLLVLRSGTSYQMMSPPLHPCPPSGAVWRLNYSAALTTLTNSIYCSDYSGPRGGVAA